MVVNQKETNYMAKKDVLSEISGIFLKVGGVTRKTVIGREVLLRIESTVN